MSNFYFSFLNRLGLFSKKNPCASVPPGWRKSTTINFTFALFLLGFLFNTGFSFAQSTANYVFSTNSTSSLGFDANGNMIDLSTGASPLVPAASDQGVSPITNIGFNYIFFGNTFSQFSVSANGILQLGPTAVSSSTYVASGGTISAPKFSAMGSDGQTASLANGGGVFSKIVGTGTNRCLVVQWVSHLWYLNTTNPATFQIRLYESTGVIEYVYGEMNTGSAISSAYSVGFSAGTLANQLASITTGTNTVSTTLFNTNVYTANTNIANLHSTTEGSRRSYSFTPPTTVSGDVSNLTFTAIVANGVTLNWDDNATNEAGFVVTRATDVALTQNVATFSVASTTAGTIGNPYSLVQTGIGAGTTYYYKVVAIVEAGISTGITGNVSTLAGATYYWTGATGGNWNAFANWNTAADGTGTVPAAWDNSDVYVIDGEGTTSGGALSIVVDRTSFTVGQIRIVGNTNLTLASSATTTRTITILGGPNEDFLLEAGSTLNLTSATNAIAFVFSGSGNTGLLAGTYTAAGSTSNIINVNGSSATVVTGTVLNNILGVTGCLAGSVTTLSFAANSNYTHTGNTTGNGYIPVATWAASATATLTGGTTTTGLTSGSPILGNLVINTSASTATLNAFAGNIRTIQGDLVINNTGSGRFRAVSSGLLTVNGTIFVNGGIFDISGSSAGRVVAKGNVTIANGATLDINQGFLQVEMNIVNNGAILSSETTTATSVLNFIGTTTPQTLSGAGTFTGRVSSIGVSNPVGLTISTPVLTQRVNLFTGTITGSSNITIGTGLVLSGAVQIGSASNTTPGGNFDVAPIFSFGTGAYTLLYSGETTVRTTGFEVPSSRSVTNLSVDNANGLIISGGTIEVTNGLSLTNGIVTSTLANHIVHGSATASGILTGGSTTSYISGPLVRTIADTNTAFVLFPVGKAQYAPVSLAPTTTEVTLMRAEAFDSNLGTANPAIINLSANRRWQTALVSGAFTDVKVRVADALIASTNIPVQAPSAAGAYTSVFGSTATFSAGTPNVIESNAAVTAANFTGFLSFADSNACIGTPTPGNTIASANAICLGSSVTLSLQNNTIGSGITYQWKSSTDGVNFTDVVGANGATLSVTPMVATFYKADVTCSTGPATGTSTAVQITFGNTVASTTPAARCGVGTVTLAATPSAGATINWYAGATGGVALASGPTFETPSISTTATYYAAAEVASPLGGILGAGGTISTSVGGTFLPGAWGGAKTQYIVKATELTAAGVTAGTITNLGFEATTSGQTYQGFVVQMGTTTQTEANTTFISGLTQVYRGTLADDGFTPVANAVNTLLFGTGSGSASTFTWDGTSNIVISIAWSRVPSASTATVSGMKVDNVGFNSTAWRQRDNLTPAAMLAETSASSVGANRPRFIINNTTICSSSRVAVTATVSAPPVFTLSTGAVTICSGSASNAVTATAGTEDYDTYVWSPATGVTGNSTMGWVFNPTASTTYTLTASQSAGSLCATIASFAVVVNPVPTPITFNPATPTVCTESIQALTANGGTIGSNGSTTIGAATTLTIENNNDPTAFNNRFEHYWLQMVFTQAELIAAGVQAGNVNGIKFQIASIGSAANVTDFRVRLGSTAVNTLTGFIPTGLTEVYSTPIYTQAIGVNSIVFNTPYVWDGTSNIIVDIRSTGVDLSNNSQTFFTATTDNKTVSAVTSTTFASSNAYAASNPTGTLSLKRLNTTFDWSSILPTAVTWAPITNLFSDAEATLAYVEGTPATTVYFKSNAVGTVNYTATATSTLDCSVVASTSVNVVDCGIPYANLQFPGVATIGTCVSPTYYARVYKAGVTEAAGQGAGIQAWIGRNATNTDPSTWSEDSWQIATFNVQTGNDDEYQTTFGPALAGTYYVASRFLFQPGNFVYGGFSLGGGGIWNGTNNANGILTVESTPAPMASAQTFCNEGTVADLMAIGTAVQWYAGSTGGSALVSTTALATGTYYVSQTLNSCESARTMVAVTVNVTAAPMASAQTFCNAGTVADLMATGTAVQWYAGSTGGSALASTTALATGTYYVSQTLNSCESARTMVAVTVNVTAVPTASAQTFCNAGSVADLMATGTAVQWYAGSTGGSALASTTALTTGNYYVSQTLNSCESARTMVAVTVNVTAAPTAVAQTFCNSATVANLVTTSGVGIQWYAGSTGGSALVSTTALATGTYYVSQTLNSCESARTMVAVTVNVTAAPTAVAQTFCNSATVANLVTTSGVGIQWYTGSTGGTALASTTALTTGNYYVSQTLNSCESARTMVAVTVNVTAAPTAVAQTFCNSATVANLVTTSGVGIQWYAGSTGGSALASTTALATGNYYVSQTVAGCESVRTMVAVVIGITSAPTGTATQDFTTGQTLADFTVVGQNIIWYSSATGTTVLPSTTVLVSGTIYYASQTVNGCESTTRLAVTAGVDLKTPTFEISNLRYYPNPVQNILTVEYAEAIEGVQVYNMLGQLVYNRNTNTSKVLIEMTNMAAGNYILQVTINGITKNVKVIKK